MSTNTTAQLRARARELAPLIEAGDANAIAEGRRIARLLEAVRRQARGSSKIVNPSGTPTAGHVEVNTITGEVVDRTERLSADVAQVRYNPRYASAFDRVVRNALTGRAPLEGLSGDQRALVMQGVDPANAAALVLPVAGPTQLRSWTPDVSTQGGYLVPRVLEQRLRTRAPNWSGIVALANTVIADVGDAFMISRHTAGTDDDPYGTTSGWGGVENTSLAAIGRVNIPLHYWAMSVKFDRRLVWQPGFDVIEQVQTIVTDMAEQQFERAMLVGSGVGQPYGILNRTGTGALDVNTVNVGTAFDAASLGKLFAALRAPYRANAVWVIHDQALVDALDVTTGATGGQKYASHIQPVEDVFGRQVPSVWTRPLYASAYMEPVAASSRTVLFGDLTRAYTIVRRAAYFAEVLTGSVLQEANQTGFQVSTYLGGDVVEPWAVKVGVMA